MNKNWKYFVTASIVAGFALVKNGAPPIAVAVGIAGAAVFLWRRSQHC